ncbi:MAG TPA: hypothetical protein VK196_09445 [Magnetospirillum sp.]|nr:hypothetical protein [Magnetospirillum sp.]
MDARAIGLVLLWLGTILLVAVLQHRLRKGALGQEAFENPPPIERWSVALAAGGMVLVATGAGLSVWGPH